MSFILADLVREHGSTRPQAPAITYGDSTVSFADLDRRSSQVANDLLDRGVRAGDRVAVLDKNSPAFFELIFGCSKIGAVLVGLNWRLSAVEIASILSDAQVSGLLVEPGLASLVQDVVIPFAITMGTEYEQWIAGAGAEDPGSSSGEVVLQLYSSGTTGRPEGAMITNENLAYTVRMAAEAWEMTADSVNLVPSPLFHIGGAGYGLTALSQGGHTVLPRDADPASLLALIEKHRVTHGFLVPAVIQSLVDAPAARTADVSSLRLIGYGAAPMTESLLRRAFEVLGCRFLGVYGMTETAGTVVVLRPDDHDPGGSRAHLHRSVGRLHPWVELAVKDPVTAEDCGVGRSRRDLDPVGPERTWVLEPAGDHGPDPRGGRLVAHWRRCAPGRRGLPVPARPPQGHDHLGRRERLPG
jgi:acyl-CoA synthetase (AMP-forming)/AMP-acid ligase II